MISRVSLCIGGITWCLQPRCEFAASFWVCSLVLNMWPHSDKEYAQLSKRDRVVLHVGPAFITHYMMHILYCCMVSKTVSNESTHQQHFHRTCTSQNFIIEYSWYYKPISSNRLKCITNDYFCHWVIYANLIQKTSICICLFEENPPRYSLLQWHCWKPTFLRQLWIFALFSPWLVIRLFAVSFCNILYLFE